MENLEGVVKALCNKEQPLAHRKEMLVDLLHDTDDETAESLLERMSAKALSEEARQNAEEIADLIENLQRAPMKPGTFIGLETMEESSSPHALVLLDDGEMAYLALPDKTCAGDLRLGDRIALDGKAKILLAKSSGTAECGTEAFFERALDASYIEVQLREEKRVLFAHHHLMDKIQRQSVKPGDAVVVAPSGKLALPAVKSDGLTRYQFLDRGAIPDVIVSRDIGAPPKVIESVCRHIREEMSRPELRRKFGLRPCITRLLSGVSGSGKTLAIQAIHHQMYDIMAELTGTEVEALPKRVFRFKTSAVLSKWLGESDKNADRLFDEVEALAKEPFTNRKGKTFKLPVMVVMEEAEGMGRTRGEGFDPIYDRILSTLLQRLDPNRAGLANELVVFLSTTNEPHLVDPAFLRRIGGSIETFGLLNQSEFIDVLSKHVAGLPAQDGNGKTQKKLWAEINSQLESWLYGEETRGIVEVVLPGKPSLIKFHRDFLTGALIDRATQEAAHIGWESSLKDPAAGIKAIDLQNAIAQQVTNIARQLTPQNITHYLDLPENCKVTAIRLLA